MAWKPQFTQGITSFKASRLDEALGHFTQASKSHRHHLPEYQPATQALEEVGGDKQHVIYDSRAAVYEKLGMPKEALRDAKSAIVLAQDQWQGYYRAARLFLLARKFDASWKMSNMAFDRVKPENKARRDEITKLRDQAFEAQQAEERRIRLSQNQFEKLPVELLGEIFHRVMWDDVAALIGLLRVCRYWRNVAMRTPSLWEILVLTSKSPARKLSVWLKQSNGQIRELHARAGATSDIDWPFQELKDLPWDRIRVCNVASWDVAGYLIGNGLAPPALGALEAFEMQEQITQRRFDRSLFSLLQTTSVRSISLVRTLFSWQELSDHLTSLTSLNVFDCGTNAAGILPTLLANPGLETLIIQDNISYSFPATATPVCLSNLRHLELQGMWSSNLLELVSGSTLETCKIKGSRGTLDTALAGLNDAHNLSNLTHLAIDSTPVSAASLIRLLNAITALNHLELTGLSKCSNIVMEALAGTPTPPSSQKTQAAGTREERILCPMLTHINVSHCSDIRTGPLVRLVRARLPPFKPRVASDAPVQGADTDMDAAAMVVDDSEPPSLRATRILGLTLDGCEQIDADWLPWFRKQVPAISCVYHTRKKATWK
ncbi:hypothetical protein DXG03_004921 [Asterophora parasitica]|uniref:F-box domain-containing protein n=1 Tax=Asterophora parasitica TaxID=117018 RepID=A0A9P7GEX3_9AGAR|nr:hypothetical protein DXG03_004921 [Asterophora parasitica]